MRARTIPLLLAFLGPLACTHPPRWVRRTPVLKLLYRPWGQPYLENPKFSFEIKRDWKGPESAEGGVRFRAPASTARVTVSYFLEGAPGWRDKKAWGPWMRQQGSTADRHIVDSVEVSSRPAAHVVFTEHEYDPEYLLGARSSVRRIELSVINDEQGVFVVRYEGLLDDALRHRATFLRFLDSLALAFVDPPPTE